MPGWVSLVDDGRVMSAQDLCTVKKFLRVIAGGARLVMREYARLKEVMEGDARELRQLSIVQFTGQHGNIPKARKAQHSKSLSNAPSDAVWIATDADCLEFEWKHVSNGVDVGVEASPGSAALGRVDGVPAATARKPSSKWKTGLNWFSPMAPRTLGP